MVSERWTYTLVALALHVSSMPTLHAEPSDTQKVSARALMDEGHARRAKGDHKGALESFRAAHALVGAPRSGVEVGRSLLDLGRLVEAREAFLAVTRLPKKSDEPPPTLAARAEALALTDDLEKRIPTLRVVVLGATGPVDLSIDGRESAVALTEAVLLDPGPHTVRAASGKLERIASIALVEGERRSLTIELTTASGPTVAPVAPTRTVLILGLTTLGVGAIAGTATGLFAFSKARAAKAGCDGTQCPPSTHDDLEASRRFGTVSNISFAVAGAGVLIAIAGLILPPSEKRAPALGVRASPFVGLGSVGLTGTF